MITTSAGSSTASKTSSGDTRPVTPWPALDLLFRGDPDGRGHAFEALADIVQGALVDYAITAIDEGPVDRTPPRWRVYFPTPAERDAAHAGLAQHFPVELTVSSLDVEDEDWAARSQRDLRAVRVGRLVVAPPWDLPSDSDVVTIVIQPSMGFGTGHHATTRLCLAALQGLELGGRSVLDVGTGSGVLAMAARRLGAAQVLGIDDDELAIEAARGSLRLNPQIDITLGVADVRRLTIRPFDTVLANLTGGLIVDAAAALHNLTRDALVLSGFLETERAAVLSRFDGFRVDHETSEDGWCCLVLRRPPRSGV